MSKEFSIWSDGIYGMVFNGRIADPKAPVRYISERSKLIVLELPSRMGRG